LESPFLLRLCIGGLALGGLREGIIMRITGSRHAFVVAALATLAALVLPGAAIAQQVTYYDFDTPQANPSQVSRQCSSTGAPSGVLFCFNDATGANASPSFLSDTYPPIIDPVTTDNPPVSSTHFATQMTAPQELQSSSMWFSVPQKVANGFTSYFAFKMTPNANSFATADGIAFVIQNSSTGGTAGTCQGTGSGLSAAGGNGGCIGYGGIDNSVAIELDTYQNPWDPVDIPGSLNDNHIAIQNCGAGLPNSPDHTGSCLVQLSVNGAPLPAIIDPPGVTMADGNVHQVVVEYSGPNEATPFLLQIFIDPPFVPGTHTPAAGAVPALSGIYNIGANVNLINSGTANDSAYVGFTSGTGAAFEQHEVMAWTFTPHATVTQVQPLNPPGQPTVFPFGSHVYAVTYPENGPPTSGINMVVTASAISPMLFSQLVSGGPFSGSQCQVYDDTGGNCEVYSVSCINTATNTFTQCPTTTTTDPINVKTAFNNTLQPITPGFIQGDPFYSPVTSISGDGATATVTCTGECSVIPNQVVTVMGTSNTGFNGTITVVSASPSTPNVFTFASTTSGTASGGFLTSNNLQNIFVSYSPQRIDGSIAGKTLNFSDLIATSLTTAPTMLTIAAPAAAYGAPAAVTVTATSGNGIPTGNILLSVDGGAPITEPLSSTGVASFSLTGLNGGMHTLSATYPLTGAFQGNTATGSLTINAVAPTVTFTGAPMSAVFNTTFAVSASSNASTTAVITAGGACSILGNTVKMTSGTGVCSLTASWAADMDYTPGSATQMVTAVKAASTTAILSDTPNPSVVKSPVLLTFSVSGNGTPTGTYSVASSVAGDPTCGGSIAAGGGSCPLTFLTPGARTLTVTYAGDSNFTGSSTTVQQSVSGAPFATVSPGSLNFGTLYLGGVGEQSVTLTNTGSATMTVNEPFLFDVGNGDSKEFVALSLCPGTLAVGKSCTIYVFFIAGPSYNLQTAILKIMDNAPGSPQSVNLSATVINPQASFSPNAVKFGTVRVGTPSHASVVLTSSGATPLSSLGISVTGGLPGEFTESNGCPTSLSPGAKCTISVTFTPGRTGSRSAYLNVVDNVNGGPQQVLLSGTGN
jgi:hypothetical protein